MLRYINDALSAVYIHICTKIVDIMHCEDRVNSISLTHAPHEIDVPETSYLHEIGHAVEWKWVGKAETCSRQTSQ